MKKIIWEVHYRSAITAVRYCKKCGKKSEYVSTGLFRVNAQRKYLDIWLIYNCAVCDTTWNATIYSRINPQNLRPEKLEQFHMNDKNLAEQYAMDVELLCKNGAEVTLPKYFITGDEIGSGQPTEVHIVSKFPCRLKIAAILREKLQLSRKAFEKMLDCGQIRSIPETDLTKCKLHTEMRIIILL